MVSVDTLYNFWPRMSREIYHIPIYLLCVYVYSVLNVYRGKRNGANGIG